MQQVTIPLGYFFTSATRFYENWHDALVRELFQNSDDARATNFDIQWDESLKELIVKDDGIGMDKDTLIRGLLSLGGSVKTDDDTGGFGEAKMLLLFSWPKWKVETRNLCVEGSEGQYGEIQEDACYIKGTRITITLREDPYVWSTLEEYVGKCQPVSIKAVTFNGHVLPERTRKGRLVKTFPWGTLHQIKSREDCCLSVRRGGKHMFNRWIGEGYGTLVLELTGDSTGVLTSNRDGLNWNYCRKLDLLVQDLLVNKMSALKETLDEEIFEELDGCSGLLNKEDIQIVPEAPFPLKVEVKAGTEIQVTRIGDLPPQPKVAPEAREAVPTSETDVPTETSPVEQKAARTKGLNGLFDGLFEKAVADVAEEARKPKGLEHRLHGLPHVTLQYSRKQRSLVKRYINQKRTRTYLELWIRVLIQVMIDNDIKDPFCIGLTFDPHAGAVYLLRSDLRTFLLNPTELGKITTPAQRWELIEELKDLAIHEIAHVTCKAHDECHEIEMARIRRATRKSWRKYRGFIQHGRRTA